MRLTLRQLTIFDSVVRHLSFTRASEELYLSQPAVSMQIKQLEESVGLELFEKMGKSLYLTYAGRELCQYSKNIAKEIRDAEDAFTCMKDLNEGQLSITVASTANYFAAHLFAKFSRRHPKVRLSLDVTNRENLIRQLKDNECDLVIMGKPPAELDVVKTHFMENPLVIIAPPDHPLCGCSDISLEKISLHQFIVREQGSGTRSAIERFFAKHHLPLHTMAEMTSSEAIKQAVAAGLSLGIVSIHTLELELATGRLVILDVENMPILRHWYLVHRSEKRLSPIAREFSKYVLNEASNIWQPPSTRPQVKLSRVS